MQILTELTQIQVLNQNVYVLWYDSHQNLTTLNRFVCLIRLKYRLKKHMESFTKFAIWLTVSQQPTR